MPFTGPAQISTQDVFKTSTNKLMPLGTQGVTRDGRVYRYGLPVPRHLPPVKSILPPAVVPNHQNIAVQTAASVGDTHWL
jgi:hypothetical protein